VRGPDDRGPLGPPTAPSRSPREEAALTLRADATVTPRLMRALAPTLIDLTIDVFPAAEGSAVLVSDAKARQVLPLEALAGILAVPGLSLAFLSLHANIDWEPPDPEAPVPVAPSPRSSNAAARRLYAANRYQYARRNGLHDFDAVIATLAPSLEHLVLTDPEADVCNEDARPLGPGPHPIRRGQRTWLPDCLADLTRLRSLLVDGALDALRLPPYGPVKVARATTGRTPPRLASLRLSARALNEPIVPVQFAPDAFVELRALERLVLDVQIDPESSLPACLADGSMPYPRELSLSGYTAWDAHDVCWSLDTFRRGAVDLTVDGMYWRDWRAEVRGTGSEDEDEDEGEEEDDDEEGPSSDE
jgi:hypothetical protein